MTETLNGEWEHWQAAWRDGAAPAPARPTPVAEMQRRLVRHRRVAWAYTVFDVASALAFIGFALYLAIRDPRLPMIVWAAIVVVSTIVAVSFGIWNRRDALLFSAQPTSDFLALLRLRLARRARLPRFVIRFAVTQVALGLAYHAIWSPGALASAAVLYAIMMAPLVAWWWWQRGRLRRERAQLDALGGDERDDRAPP
jgi:hypothetical protein